MNDQTRRAWVFTIGQAAAGLGIAWKANAEMAQPVTLPPGVYLPSTDHLGHAMMDAGRYRALPPDCPTDYLAPPKVAFKPQFFSESDFPVIRRITQLLLGDSSLGPAISEEVAEWIDLILSSADETHRADLQLHPLHKALASAYYGSPEEHGARPNPSQICREGLDWLLNSARTQYSQEFLSLAPERQIAILHSIGDERPDMNNQNSGTRFFTWMKTETIRGFYTSRAGLDELNFKGNSFYARSPGGCRSN